MNWLETIGRNVMAGLSNVGTAMLLVWQTIKQLKMLNAWHVLQQMAHLGVDSLPIISLTLLFAGGVMTLQITDVLITYGAQGTVGGLMAVAMGRELGPILVGVVLAGRVGAAITAEIGTMKVTEQIDALRVMAVNPIGYLVVPRVVACMIMVPILAFYGVVIGIAGWIYFVAATTIKGLAPATYLDSIQMFSTISDFTLGLIKSSVFGAVIALVGCYKGMHTKMGAEAVGFSTTSSVVTSIILVFVLNYFLSTLLF
ncbi:MAG: MlaE family ABC transporter permease [Veillonella atypica]